MTIFDITNNLLLYFTKSETFIYNKNYKEILIESKNSIEDEALIISALKDLHLNKIVELYKIDNEKQNLNDSVWILRRPLETYHQNVSINTNTAVQIATMVNNFCELAGEPNATCNPQQITDMDLNHLLQICALIIERIKVLEDKQEKKDNKKK